MLFALGVPDLHPLAFDDHAGINTVVILLVLAQVMPDMGSVGLDYGGNII